VLLVLTLAAALSLVACARAAAPMLEGNAAVKTDEADWGSRGLQVGAEQSASTVVELLPTGERLIVRNAQLSIVVNETVESMDAIRALVVQMNGWEVSSNVWQYDNHKQGNMTVRVPADSLDSFLAQVHALAQEVSQQSMSGEDVTEEYVDLGAQLSNLQATRDRVRNFLDRAANVKEALEVNTELSRLEGDIERITGRIQYLEQSALYSSVSITIIPDELNRPLTIGRWQPQGTARDAIRALLTALQWLVDVLITLVLFVLPLGVIIVGPIWLLIRFLRRRRARRRAAAG
jgi:hypothetical protein